MMDIPEKKTLYAKRHIEKTLKRGRRDKNKCRKIGPVEKTTVTNRQLHQQVASSPLNDAIDNDTWLFFFFTLPHFKFVLCIVVKGLYYNFVNPVTTNIKLSPSF